MTLAIILALAACAGLAVVVVWLVRFATQTRADFDAHRRAVPAAIRSEVATTALHLQFATGRTRESTPSLAPVSRRPLESDAGFS